MNLRFVEAFHWAASLKSITRAAEKLHITQSAMSSRIAALEEELRVVLLDRRDKQFRLTIAGQRFQALAAKLLELQRQVKQELGADPDAPTMLRIGAIESVVHSWLPGWVQEMRGVHPDFELELTVETSPVLVDQILRGMQDLVFTSLPSGDANVRSRQMPSIEMVFVGCRDIHARANYSLAELAEHDLITFQRGSQPYQMLLQLFREAEVPLRRVHAVSSISAMVRLVEGGFGIATLPRTVTTSVLRGSKLRVLRSARALSPLPIYASYREDPSKRATEAVLDSAQTYIARTSKRRSKSK